MHFRLHVCSLAVALSLAATAAIAGGAKTVVELFTSQGCSSCPPADAFLGELAKRDDVIALSFHVDYWNYIGWRDPFSKPQWSIRQRAYGSALHRSYVYTPQMVIDGAAESVGSERARVSQLIAEAGHRKKIAVEMSYPREETIRIRVPAKADYTGSKATVWLAFFDRERDTAVSAGENRGRTLTSTNIVRSLARIGAWHGEAVEWTLPVEAVGGRGRDGCAILVQADGHGRIIGATAMTLH